MVGDEPSMMTNSEILAVSKILLENRAFTKRELKTILDKMVEGCVPLKNMKLKIAGEAGKKIEPQKVVQSAQKTFLHNTYYTKIYIKQLDIIRQKEYNWK